MLLKTVNLAFRIVQNCTFYTSPPVYSNHYCAPKFAEKEVRILGVAFKALPLTQRTPASLFLSFLYPERGMHYHFLIMQLVSFVRALSSGHPSRELPFSLQSLAQTLHLWEGFPKSLPYSNSSSCMVFDSVCQSAIYILTLVSVEPVGS